MDAATELESRVEDLVDGIVNEIASSGLAELVVVERVAQRYGLDRRLAGRRRDRSVRSKSVTR